ncbi:hypothetical protein NDA10_004972 [Ustilago hordei]|uniref:Uncharacterized protein n=1 Tax=Ustilago hordei TaxID=120017 RepID=I2G2M0_USTHO|nr:hypothetical protein NDA10_004972 [Ustilago hordei]KAJ1585596.1 hypothetical protein NDA15_007737 [Ustilago hordei]KAJ1587723.1 hypothetical protein NDA12_000031 [Ustilago hordei]CCF53413.1 uncharacterized protein UHOR_15967 [Ustilago hordei]
MLNPDYSSYKHFIWVIEELLPHLPDIVQNHYHQLINENTYGTPKEPKAGLIFKYTRKTNAKQVVTPLTIMIECVAALYHAMHVLGPFHSHFELEWQMRTCVTLFIGNEKDATCILHFMTEDPRWFELEAAALEWEFNVTSSKGGNVIQDSMTDKASDLEEELNTASSKGGNVVQDSMMDEASDLEELDMALSEGGNVMQISKMDEASDVALTTMSKLDVTLTTREFIFNLTAAAGDGLIITGPSFVNAVAAHHGLHTSLSTVSHPTSIDMRFNIKINDKQPLPKPLDALTMDGDKLNAGDYTSYDKGTANTSVEGHAQTIQTIVMGPEAQEARRRKSYEEEHRNRRIGLCESLRQSSLRSVVGMILWHNPLGSTGTRSVSQNTVGKVIPHQV